MKKVLIGCGILVLVLGIGGMVGAYFYVWKPAKAAVTEFAKLKEIPKINQQITNTKTFAEPSDNTLTKDAVDRFVRTQNTMLTNLRPRVEELDVKYRWLEDRRRSGRDITLPELVGAYKDFASLIVELKRSQVAALNENNYSLAEYDWTRQRIYEALGYPINTDVQKVLREIAEGKMPSDLKSSGEPAQPIVVPEKNRELVAPHAKELGDRGVLAVFGL